MSLKLLSLREYSLSFKNIFTDDFIDRPNLLEEIEEIASSDHKIIIVEGNEGIGKTNILLQFAKKHNFTSFSYFANPSCKFTAKPDYLIEDLGKQILFHLNSDKIEEDTIINEGVFNNLLMDLIRRPLKKDKKIFFILDGLDQLEKSEIELIKPLILSLPWTINNFFFVISGSSEKLEAILDAKVLKKAKNFRVIRFSYEETLKFFNWEDSPNAKEIHTTWNGHPERLAQIKRILNSGIDINDFIIRNDFREKDDLLEIEWKNSQIDKIGFNSSLVKIVCILAFDENLRRLDKILEIAGSDHEDILTTLNTISFIKVKDEELSFISASYRKYAIKRLARYQKQTFSLLIGYYKEQNELSILQNLPVLLDKNQDWNSIIELLTVGNLSLLVSNSKSFAEIKRELNFGYKASSKLKNSQGEIFKFALYRSLVNGLQKSDVREAQLEAYISLGRQGEIFSLISKAVLKEDRLRMLIKYAKESKIQDLSIDDIFIQEIKDKIEDLDTNYLKENIVEIATGLAYFLPEYAVSVIERAFGKKQEEGSLELLIGYIAHIMNGKSGDLNSLKGPDLSSVKLGQTFGEKFSESIGFGIGELPEHEILDTLPNVKNISDRLYLVKVWIKKNCAASNIVEVMSYAINILLESSSTIKPTTTSLLDIFEPLLTITDKDSILSMIGRLDELMSQIQSPNNHKIKLSLLIVEALVSYDITNANERIFDLYEDIDKITDHSSKIEALANVWMLLKNLNAKSDFSISEFIFDESNIQDDLNTAINLFLENCAEHFDEIENTFEIIPRISLSFAIETAKKLNTSDRRSEALVKCISIYSETHFSNWDIALIKEVFNSLTEPYYSFALSELLNQAFEQKDHVSNYKNKLFEIIPLITKTIKYSEKCKMLSKCIYILSLEPTIYESIKPSYSKSTENLKKFLETFYNKIDDPIKKINIGYSLASLFSSVDKTLAEFYFNNTETLSESSIIDNRIQLITYIESVRISIRLHCKLVDKDGDYPYHKISTLIELVPSNIERVSLWSEFAIRTHLKGNKSISDEIVSRKIIPILDLYTVGDYNYHTILRQAAPAIYFSQQENFKLLISPLSDIYKEMIVVSVCFTILSRVHESEPYEDRKGFSEIKFQEASEYINLLDYLKTDSLLYRHIKNLAGVAKNSPANFSREQKNDIKRRLTKLIENKLPNSTTGIKHIGYKIVSKAAITHFNVNKPGERVKEFDDLEREAIAITNATDMALVLIMIARECPIRKKKLDLLLRSFDVAEKILSLKEKITIQEQALDELSLDFQDAFREKIFALQNDILKLEESDRYVYYRKLIDLAFRHDKALAIRLLSTIESDPGRKQLKSQVTDHYDLLETEKVIQDDYSKIGRFKNRKQMGKMVYKMLAELNSGNRKPKNLEQTIQMIYTASTLPFFYSLPLFEFFIENLQGTFPNREGLLIAFCDAAQSNAKLCYNLISSISNKNYTVNPEDHPESDNMIILKPGMREKGFEFIEKFIRTYAKEEIYILDPYFSQKDITFLKDLASWADGANIAVLTSCKGESDFAKSSYINAWRHNSSETPPPATFVSVSNQLNDTPFHDRWIILPDEQLGLALGSSINSLGNKLSSISTLSPLDVETIMESVVGPLFKTRQRHFGDQQIIKYEMFEL